MCVWGDGVVETIQDVVQGQCVAGAQGLRPGGQNYDRRIERVVPLLSPDTLRRLSWDPPQPCDAGSVAEVLAGYGARPWQIELTAGPVAGALTAAES